MPSPRLRRLTSAPLAVAAFAAIVLAAGMAPAARAVAGLSLTTPFPGVSSSPDSRVSFDLSLDATARGRVDLDVTGVPASWTASLHGGGLVVTSVLVGGEDPVEVRLDVDVPADATGTTRLVVIASDSESRVELPITIDVEAEAAGVVTVEPDFPALRGAAGGSFTFNLAITNDRVEDLTFTATGQGPLGWTVDARPAGQSQAVSDTVEAGGTASVTVSVDAPDNAAAGTYDIAVVTTVGTEPFEVPLQVEITGSFSLALSTPEGLLSAHGPSGSVTEQELTLTNTGTSPITNVKLTATAPTNWTVTFDTETTATIAPDQEVTVKALITPSGNAIAGDYNITFRANGEEADSNVLVRFTVETSVLGAIIGALLIVAAIGGLYWVFRRYGRR